MSPEADGRAPRVLVTGASGFVGSAVADALREAGYRVRVLVRPTSPRRNLSPDDEVVTGDICDRSSVAAALQGVAAVVHAAADYRLWARSPAELVRTNVEGTRIVAEEALRAGVGRFVHTSSVATLAPGNGEPMDESARIAPEAAIGSYKRSKVMAERLIERMTVGDGLPAIIVNPSTPIGRRDIRPTPTGRIIVAAGRGRLPAYVDTGLNFVHVEDVARGHVLALQKGRIGERYILGGDNVTLATLLGRIAELSDRRAPTVRLPRALAHAAASAAEFLAGFTGREPLATRDGVRMSAHTMYFTSAKAKAELGYAARPYVEGVADAIAWFRAAGYLG